MTPPGLCGGENPGDALSSRVVYRGVRVNSRIVARCTCRILLVFVVAASALAQTPPQYEPQVGQPGKDVVWMPMPDDQLERLLDMAKVTAADSVVESRAR